MLLKLVDIFGYLSVILRAGTLVFQSLLLGGSLFLLWIASPGGETTEAELAAVRRSASQLLRISAIALVMVQALYLYVNSAALTASAEIGWRDVIGANFFIAGSIILGASIMVAILATSAKRSAQIATGILVAVVLASSIATNHAASRLDGRLPLIVLSTLHELATGFWIGGLPFLLLGLYRAGDSSTQWYMTKRFSRLALVSVVMLVASGVAMSVAYVGSLRALYGTSYGVMVMAKAAMLAVLLLIGGINFLLLRRAAPAEALPRLRRLVEAEVGIGITIVLTAASLTSQPPAVDVGNDTVGLSRIVARMTPHWPRLQSPELAQLSTSFPAESISVPAGPPLPAAYTVDGIALSAGDLADIQWSEYNHHWMGVLVLLMGVLALLARTGRAPWAEYWPLLLIGIAVFIFLRADPECWPLGPQGFWATWAKPEVFQHRLAGLLCVGFAIFELRVRQRGQQAGPASLVFPLLCAAGGALLLTHSHSLVNIREELLAEMSHVPMGILAVMAGWSRWLEIRLPVADRKYAGWIWPVCFVLIGAGLLNYREM